MTSHDEYGELMTNSNRLLASLSQRSKGLQESESYNKVLFAQSHIPWWSLILKCLAWWIAIRLRWKFMA